MFTLLDASTPTLPYDLYAHYGRSIIEASHKKIPENDFTAAPVPIDGPVGILGAGPGGLYAALILDDLDIPYQILESQGRVGGRLFTYTFPDREGHPAYNNYFDVGAMRFPRIESMKRVFHLFEYDKLNQNSSTALKGKLRPYYFKGGGNHNSIISYNGVTISTSAGFPTEGAKELLQHVPDGDLYVRVGTAAIVEDVIKPFVLRLLEDLKTGSNAGWKYLQSFEMHSTRSYMGTVYLPSNELVDLGLPVRHLPTDVINWLETFDKATGSYDRSFAETVLGAIAFGHVPKSLKPRPTAWFCIDGGSVQIAKCMEKYITSQQPNAISLKSRVTAVGLDSSGTYIDIVTNHNEHHQFSHVISTIPLPVLRTVDLSGSKLSLMQTNALRQLTYGQAVKIGIQFKEAWWTKGSDQKGNPLNIIGGQTSTDTILRTVVYPSHGGARNGETTTLIASYCATADAERLAALIMNDQEGLKNLVLRELAHIHNVKIDFLEEQFIAMKGWSWTNDPHTMGAYPFFGPGKFESLYTSLTDPAAKGRFHFAGEAISVRHAWMEGALDSTWRAIREMLLLSGDQARCDKFLTNWGSNPEWIKVKQAAKGKKPEGAPTDGGPETAPVTPELEDDLMLQRLKHLHPEFFSE